MAEELVESDVLWGDEPPAVATPLLVERLLTAAVRIRAWASGRVFTAGSIVLVFDDGGRVLLARQWYRRGWSLPGGYMEPGEQAIDAAVRECREEVGLDLEVADLRLLATYVQSGRRHIEHVHIHVRPIAAALARPARRREIASVAWFGVESLPLLQREADEAFRNPAVTAALESFSSTYKPTRGSAEET